MEIIFESTGSTAGLENWLSSFKQINDSLLIEVDTNNEQFVAKTHTTDKTIVKYGKLSFESAGLKVASVTGSDKKKVGLEEWNEVNNSVRIKVGIFQVIDKFIKVVNRFSGTDGHKIIIKFAGADYVAQSVAFKSAALDMMVTCADIDEFVYISDDKFLNGIAAIDNPMSFEVNLDINKSLLDISSIFSADAKKDIVDFSTVKSGNDWILHAVDRNGQSYDYKIAYLSEASNPVEITVPVIRNNYILATKGDTANSVITLPGIEGGGKIKIASGDNFITIIASVRV